MQNLPSYSLHVPLFPASRPTTVESSKTDIFRQTFSKFQAQISHKLGLLNPQSRYLKIEAYLLNLVSHDV